MDTELKRWWTLPSYLFLCTGAPEGGVCAEVLVLFLSVMAALSSAVPLASFPVLLLALSLFFVLETDIPGSASYTGTSMGLDSRTNSWATSVSFKCGNLACRSLIFQLIFVRSG